MGVIAALVAYHDWLRVTLVLVVLASAVLESLCAGAAPSEKSRLHPLIFAILGGGVRFLGVLLALPIASVANVLLRRRRYRAASSA